MSPSWDRSNGEMRIDLRTGQASRDDPATGPSWGAERTIEADFVASVITNRDRRSPAGRARAVRVYGARIAGAIDKMTTPVALSGSRIATSKSRSG